MIKEQVNIITKDDPKTWSAVLNRMTNYDFYHTPSYNSFYQSNNCEPVLFHYSTDSREIALPLLLRDIDGFKGLKDVTSSYGYVGPVTSSFELNEKIVAGFQKALSNFFQENNVVSAFSRLHPYIGTDHILNGLGEINPLSETVYIDLQEDLNIQRSAFKKGVKSDLSKLKKDGFNVTDDKELKHWPVFKEIYNENMVRVNAKDEYFFDDEYYKTLLFSPDIKTKLYFVEKDNQKIAGSLFVFTKNIIQYHLSGTRNDFLKNSPVRLIIDYVRQAGKPQGYEILHLGGGVGSEEDSLFKFKSGFSKHRLRFKIWKHIVDVDKYNYLVSLNVNIKNKSYFPLYRG